MKTDGGTTFVQPDFFFWLGADGEVEEVTEEEFNANQTNARADRENWLNVRLPDEWSEDVAGV